MSTAPWLKVSGATSARIVRTIAPSGNTDGPAPAPAPVAPGQSGAAPGTYSTNLCSGTLAMTHRQPGTRGALADPCCMGGVRSHDLPKPSADLRLFRR